MPNLNNRPISLDSASLEAFFGEVRLGFRDDARLVADELPALFKELEDCLTSGSIKKTGVQDVVLPFHNVRKLLAELVDPIAKVEASGLICDPWSAARLQKDELRNAATLRWFLDQRSYCGGKAFLEHILQRVRVGLPGFPIRLSPNCSVLEEECPDGNLANRVDIQIDDETFFLVIEVKIKAGEQPDQIGRYCQAASSRCGGRPFAVIFLTVDGRGPTTAGDWEHKVVSLSWSQLATSLRRSSLNAQPIPRFLAQTFADHISDF